MPHLTVDAPPIPRPVDGHSVSRRGSTRASVLVALAAAVAAGCMLGDGISPQRFRRYGAAIDHALAVSIDDWLGMDTLTIPELSPENWFLFDAFIEYGQRDLSYREPAIGQGEEHVARQ